MIVCQKGAETTPFCRTIMVLVAGSVGRARFLGGNQEAFWDLGGLGRFGFPAGLLWIG